MARPDPDACQIVSTRSVLCALLPSGGLAVAVLQLWLSLAETSQLDLARLNAVKPACRQRPDEPRTCTRSTQTAPRSSTGASQLYLQGAEVGQALRLRPGVVHDVLQSQALAGVLDQHALQQVPQRGGDFGGPRELQGGCADGIVQAQHCRSLEGSEACVVPWGQGSEFRGQDRA